MLPGSAGTKDRYMPRPADFRFGNPDAEKLHQEFVPLKGCWADIEGVTDFQCVPLEMDHPGFVFLSEFGMGYGRVEIASR